MLELRAYFIKRFGPPRWTIIHGQSMGGHISIASLELYPEVYQGALIECGNIDGVGLTDWLHAYTTAAEYFSGLPLLDTPRPEFDTLANGPWLGVMGEPGYYTERGRRFIRHYGLLASATCKANIARARELIAASVAVTDPPAEHDDANMATGAGVDHRPPCPCCGGRMIIVESFGRGGQPRAPPSSQAAVRTATP